MDFHESVARMLAPAAKRPSSQTQRISDYLAIPDAEKSLAKLTPIVVPTDITGQWADDLRHINPRFKIVMYYGDARDKQLMYATPKGKVTKKSKYFDGSTGNANVVIITSYQY
jgi:SNF2 family DNA or RNA helicase